jgi:septum formation protein
VRLILASGSPRRRELLVQAGLLFEIHPADIDETRRPNEAADAYVQRLALEKALAIHALHPDAVVLGADTTVVLDGAILNKPIDTADAEQMLRRLAGREHQVYTGIAVVAQAERRSDLVKTIVTFDHIPEPDLQHYLRTGDSLDKAGAYGIQGYAARWIPRIDGDFFNVVGLPLAATLKLLNGL